MLIHRYGAIAALATLVCITIPCQSGPILHKSEVLVGAASSMTDVMQEIASAFRRVNPSVHVQFTFASSGLLARQIANGAPIDLFIAASQTEIGTVSRAHKTDARSAKVFAKNRLVLIAPKDSKLKGFRDLNSNSVKRIAIGNPETVPAGRYAKEALIHRLLWQGVEARLVFAENVRQTFAYVTSGNVDVGLVYFTDANREPRVRVVETAKEGTDHQPIQYFAATTSQNESAVTFQLFLTGKTARSILQKAGFVLPKETRKTMITGK